ncbi:Ig-like domain repeat protein [Nocardioides anomalus]|uniref:Ig-like domain repeat protein n=1 Tax=Nocardioides anomalus TaxID=2712223 RepID=A0A6G6W9T6_9ACTN|nr:Ig-like domain-containing protein [Nocardioides anomalus]QIG41865.1 Ig-like domain repeat protein [Nocardioides anomalus]
MTDDLPEDGTVASGATLHLTFAPTATQRTPDGMLDVDADGWGGVTTGLVDGVATVPLAGLAPGAHELRFSYGGGSWFQALTLTRSVTVRGTEPPPPATIATSTALSLGRTTVAAGSAATASLRVATSDGSSPVGQVEVRVDGAVVATRLIGSAPFEVALPTGAVGAHTVTARFVGSAPYGDSSATAATLTVTRAAATIAAKAKRRGDGRAQVRVSVTAPVPATGTVQLLCALKGAEPKVVATTTLTGDGRAVLRSKRPLPRRAVLLVRYAGSSAVAPVEQRLRLR